MQGEWPDPVATARDSVTQQWNRTLNDFFTLSLRSLISVRRLPTMLTLKRCCALPFICCSDRWPSGVALSLNMIASAANYESLRCVASLSPDKLNCRWRTTMRADWLAWARRSRSTMRPKRRRESPAVRRSASDLQRDRARICRGHRHQGPLHQRPLSARRQVQRDHRSRNGLERRGSGRDYHSWLSS